MLFLQGPAGLRDEIFVFIGGGQAIGQVLVAGQQASFYIDSTQGVAHGTVTFTRDPLRVEVLGTANDGAKLPEKPVSPCPLKDAG